MSEAACVFFDDTQAVFSFIGKIYERMKPYNSKSFSHFL